MKGKWKNGRNRKTIYKPSQPKRKGSVEEDAKRHCQIWRRSLRRGLRVWGHITWKWLSQASRSRCWNFLKLRVMASSEQVMAGCKTSSGGSAVFLQTENNSEPMAATGSVTKLTRFIMLMRKMCHLTGFIMLMRKMCHLNQYSLSQIGNMDETPIWFNMSEEMTIMQMDVRPVPIRTTGHDKARYMFVLAATCMADGRKLQPFIVFKRVRPVAELQRASSIMVAFTKNDWMNEHLTINWVHAAHLENTQLCTSPLALAHLQVPSYSNRHKYNRQATQHRPGD